MSALSGLRQLPRRDQSALALRSRQAIGAIATFAAIFFRRFETGFMLIFVACLHVFQAYYRILAEQLYIEGKAWQASQMQIVLGTLDAISGILIVCKSGAAKGVHDKQHTE